MPRNANPFAQSQRGSAPRRGPRAPMTKYSRDVATEPCATDAFTWKLACVLQCRHGVRYPVDDAEVRAYFEPLAQTVVESIFADSTIPNHAHLDTSSSLLLTHLEYSQLKRTNKPVSASTGEFEPFEADGKRYVQDPDGEFIWELTPDLSLPYQTRLTFDSNGQELIFSYAQRGNQAIYVTGQSSHERVIVVDSGEFEYRIKHDAAKKLFFEKDNWPKAVYFGDKLVADDDTDVKKMYDFMNIEDQLCVRKIANKDDDVYIPLCNFTIDAILARYEYVEDVGADPIIKLLCSVHLGFGDETVYLKSDDVYRSVNYSVVDILKVEVVLHWTRAKTAQELAHMFARANINLMTSSMTTEHLRCYLTHDLPIPEPQRVIVRWGKQNDGTFVLSNCAFRNGVVKPVRDYDYHFEQKHFTENPVWPMATTEFPAIVIIPFDHLRFLIGRHMWKRVMKDFFCNNIWEARAVLALGVLGLNVDLFWSGSAGIGHGFPIGWIYSKEHNSGKTEAARLAAAAVGLPERAMFAGDTTKSMLFEALSAEAGLTKFIDDVVTRGGESTMLAQSIRAIFDRAARAVSGKVRLPYSSAVYTANQTINDDDKAFQSRLTTICFKPLNAGENSVVDDYYEWRKLFSSLMPDFQLLGLVDGKIDKYPIQDWSKFLHQALGKTRDRNINDLSKLGNMLVQMSMLFTANDGEIDKLFDFMIHTTTRAIFELSNHAGELDRFIIAILDIEDRIGVNLLGPNPDKLLFHHNMRKTAKPQGPFVASEVAVQWRAFRLGKVLHVIKQLTGKEFKESDVLSAAKDSAKCIVSKAQFYDLNKAPWPIKEVIQDEDSREFMEIPLKEERLLNSTLTEEKALFVRENYIKEVRDSLSGAQINIDYKSIVIESSNPNVGSYNFYEAIQTRDWFGFDPLLHHPFSNFNGINGVMDSRAGFDPTVEDALEMQGYPNMDHMLNPLTLCEWFNYSVPDPDTVWPACYEHSPYIVRALVGESSPKTKKPRRAGPDNLAEYPRTEPRVERTQSKDYPVHIDLVNHLPY